ncbi:hypothetical protein A3E39_00745 [Candidatus Uhrbacteria bacterium RIFCSPHIGHO2_12_FULL_60_25]|uniref:Uncharacterized protein n=1 Tax=Candidatus Uhrbacteria bacterium RIFCSPHIGHO2_12_FULL_60_25 TaxID=1802399 RepID=A0A1F7UMX2_9BACT|nr:MAG: hypothetical protein A3D73_00115 [Candidatus Uhrbacteria bacterium RIFCSPHIGHO2_02_FULL_60_44]OGL79636.1 MAG: hypothetical protein A3E39_00745 [Candidatus Uhrbacteria bacterium RIFCSPHIGHO2_12_FULL_60_25]
MATRNILDPILLRYVTMDESADTIERVRQFLQGDVESAYDFGRIVERDPLSELVIMQDLSQEAHIAHIVIRYLDLASLMEDIERGDKKILGLRKPPSKESTLTQME